MWKVGIFGTIFIQKNKATEIDVSLLPKIENATFEEDLEVKVYIYDKGEALLGTVVLTAPEFKGTLKATVEDYFFVRWEVNKPYYIEIPNATETEITVSKIKAWNVTVSSENGVHKLDLYAVKQAEINPIEETFENKTVVNATETIVQWEFVWNVSGYSMLKAVYWNISFTPENENDTYTVDEVSLDDEALNYTLEDGVLVTESVDILNEKEDAMNVTLTLRITVNLTEPMKVVITLYYVDYEGDKVALDPIEVWVNIA